MIAGLDSCSWALQLLAAGLAGFVVELHDAGNAFLARRREGWVGMRTQSRMSVGFAELGSAS